MKCNARHAWCGTGLAYATMSRQRERPVLSSVAACVKISCNLNLVERLGREGQVGGGCGLELGKERVRQMITSFGGRVTGAVSGKTDLVIVGKEPGFSKVDPPALA